MILRQFLHTLLIEDEGAFIRFMLAEIPPVPPKAAALRAANSGLAAAAA
ncbi:hypothetical protein ACWTU6_10450 [Mesorhizobium sp. BHbsci]